MGRKQYQLCPAVKQWLQTMVVQLERGRAESRNVATLLLDGDHQPLRHLRPLLEALGLCTLRVSTCEEVSHVFEGENPPPLLFTEPILSDGTWADILDLLKERGARATMIVVSDRVDKKLAIEVIESGAFNYLVSPVTILELVHVVRSALWHARCDRYAAGQGSEHKE